MESFREMILRVGFGMINCGDHLGVFVGPERYISGTPPGWIFLPGEDLTAKTLDAAIEAASKGTSSWPSKASYEVPKPKQQKKKKEAISPHNLARRRA